METANALTKVRRGSLVLPKTPFSGMFAAKDQKMTIENW
jgi:hypothetical protein